MKSLFFCVPIFAELRSKENAAFKVFGFCSCCFFAFLQTAFTCQHTNQKQSGSCLKVVVVSVNEEASTGSTAEVHEKGKEQD